MRDIVSAVENSSKLVIFCYIRNNNFQFFLPHSFPDLYIIEWSVEAEI
jgi:hypothetical protein